MKPPVSRRLLSRDSFKGRRLIRKHSKNFDLYFSPCHYGKNEIVFEGFVKVDGGVPTGWNSPPPLTGRVSPTQANGMPGRRLDF